MAVREILKIRGAGSPADLAKSFCAEAGGLEGGGLESQFAREASTNKAMESFPTVDIIGLWRPARRLGDGGVRREAPRLRPRLAVDVDFERDLVFDVHLERGFRNDADTMLIAGKVLVRALVGI